ncbi:MAG: outer membrane lipoprotein carrier protein LolA [Gammaproteobacteria bacterium AqS3]|nr:outer membrane lipoprotein carrier protein LolA [Gammaproteobacteria bacterium AqS3]
MSSKLLPLCLAAVLLCAPHVGAQPVEEVEEEPADEALREILKPYKSFNAELHRRLPSGDLVVSKLWFKGPEKYRLELDDGTIITGDAKRRVIYEPDIAQAVYDSPDNDLEQLPLMVFGKRAREARDIAISRLPGEVQGYGFAKMGEAEPFLKLFFENDIPSALEWIDLMGNQTRLEIASITVDSYSNKLFRQSPPPGTQILRLDQPR